VGLERVAQMDDSPDPSPLLCPQVSAPRSKGESISRHSEGLCFINNKVNRRGEGGERRVVPACVMLI
jgi:hypothetical protein